VGGQAHGPAGVDHRGLADAPELANPRRKPPDPGIMAEAIQAVEGAKEVSRLNS
jgi:hypothetical protein